MSSIRMATITMFFTLELSPVFCSPWAPCDERSCFGRCLILPALSYICFFSPPASCSCSPSTAPSFTPAALSSFRNTSSKPEKATPASMQTTGVSVSIRRTMTPAK
uniref:Putative secreted protein n=1 Tax=Anopheles triannulatus TaxID=58253 RepID=A0A2M4B0L8_9DIPT